MKSRWNLKDRFAFATQKLRAKTVPARRFDGPTSSEYEWSDDEVEDWYDVSDDDMIDDDELISDEYYRSADRKFKYD